MKSLFYGLAIIASTISLTACEKTREQFDFSKKAPDEFAVIKRAPLEMPSDFTMVTPTPGAPRPQEPSATALARGALLGEDAVANNNQEIVKSDGEAALLQKSGASNVPSNIRTVVDAETDEITRQDEPGINKLKRMIGKDVEPPAKVVDPVAEIERLKQLKTQPKN